MRKGLSAWTLAGLVSLISVGCGAGATHMDNPGTDGVTADTSSEADLGRADGQTTGKDGSDDMLADLKQHDLPGDPDLGDEDAADQTGLDAQVPDQTTLPDFVDQETEAPDVTEDLADVSQCPSEPPDAIQELPCMVWECEATAWPTCWECLFVAGPDEAACELAGVGSGRCLQGSCVPNSDPETEGPKAVEEVEETLELEGGWFGTNIPLTIYLPEGAGPYPVVVFHHGFQLKPSQYASYGQHLASWGFVVVMPEMPSGVFGVGAPNHKELMGYLGAVLDWIVADAASGTGGVLKGRANAEALGLAGHSMGGKISVYRATQDARPKALFTVDAVDAAGGPISVNPENYPSVTPEMMGSLLIPSVFLGETTNGTCEGFLCQACAPEADNFHQYFANANSPSIEIEILGANHMSFLDNPNCGITCSVCPAGTDDPATTRKLTQGYMTAFFLVHLANQPTYEEWLTGAPMQQDVAAGVVATAVK